MPFVGKDNQQKRKCNQHVDFRYFTLKLDRKVRWTIFY